LSYAVRPTRSASALIKNLPALAKRELKTVIAEVEANGCRASGYRLCAPDGDSGLCCRHFASDWRVIFLFPAKTEVTVCWVGRHTSAANLYADLAGLSDELSADGRSARVPCCDDESDPPSISDETIEFFAGLHTRDAERARR
jgi:hypothetical protein